MYKNNIQYYVCAEMNDNSSVPNLTHSYVSSCKVTSPLDCIRIKEIIKRMIDDGEKILDCRLIPNGYEILIERQCRLNKYDIIKATPGSGRCGLAFSN